ncbi:lipid A export permease/ATP-binding protein MsbA [Leeia sp.]|uniref:lipid A export permease/ATP-binding protein MsbA n=1 Tax=Leeia sp. TaxID=2884678 RepID=UPI0035B171C3
MARPATMMQSWQLYLRILRHIRPYWWVAVLAALAGQLAALTEPAFSWLLGPLININFGAHAQQTLPPVLQRLSSHLPDWGQGMASTSLALVPILFVLLFLIRGVLGFLSEYAATWLSSRLVMDLRMAMFARVLQLPVSFYDQNPTARILSRVAYDVSSVTNAGVNVLTVVFKDTAMVLGFLWVMLSIDWVLTLMALLIVPVAAISIRVAGQRLRNLNREQQHAQGAMTECLEEALQNQKVVKVFGGQAYEQGRFSVRANQVRRLGIKQAVASSVNSALVQMLIAVALAGVIYYASTRARAGGMTAGDFMSFITAMLMLSQPVQRLTKVNESLQKGLAAAESVFGLMDEAAEVDHGKRPLTTTRGDVRFEQVSFQYPTGERDVLQAVDLHIQPGQTVALVGASGSGKTTMAQLLARFYNPRAGQVLLDGVALSELPLAELRQQVALVSQDVSLFNDSVAANIAYGDTGQADSAALMAAAEAAYALEFIQQLPQGMQTVIGERGTRLSGGQKQRLAIARALYKNAPILILDEATSALDTESERQVQGALDRLMQGRTTLVIAHRLSTIERADRIVVMQEGRIIEQGTHAELLARKAQYYRLWQIQFKDAPETAGDACS